MYCPHLARVASFVLHHSGRQDYYADPGLGHVVAQFRHTEDAGLHQTPAGQTENIINTFTHTLITSILSCHYL